MPRTRYLPAGMLALALAMAACSSGESTTPTASVAASSEAAVPSSAAAATDAATASDAASEAPPSGSLSELIPDDLNGVGPQVIDAGDNPMMAQALEAAGIDATDFEYIIGTYGTGDDAVTVSAMRVPGIDQSTLEALAQQMSGAGAGGEFETVSIGGKSVLKISDSGASGSAYVYVTADAVFTVIGTDEAQVAQLLAELP